MSKCPACIKNIPAKNTTVGETDLLCERHLNELNKYMTSVIDDHEGDEATHD